MVKKILFSIVFLTISVACLGQGFPDTVINGQHFYNGSPSSFMFLPETSAAVHASWVQPRYNPNGNTMPNVVGVGTVSGTPTHRFITSAQFPPTTSAGKDMNACYGPCTAGAQTQLTRLHPAWDSDANPGTFEDTVIQMGYPANISRCSGKETQLINYHFIPDKNNSILLVSYSFVLENIVTHNKDYNPFFDMRVMDIQGNIIGATDPYRCYPIDFADSGNLHLGTMPNYNWPHCRFFVVAEGSGNVGSSIESDGHNPSWYHPQYYTTPVVTQKYTCPAGCAPDAQASNIPVLTYAPTIVAFDLTEQAENHQPVVLQLRVRSCMAEYHWAYCYFTAKMAGENVEPYAGGDSLLISVPWGLDAQSYRWYNGSDSLNYSSVSTVESMAGYPYHIQVAYDSLNPYWRCEAVSATGIPIVFENTYRLRAGISETQVACDSYTWHDQIYISSGIYTYAYIDSLGYNVTDTLHLTINQGSTSEITINCSEECYIWNGIEYCESGDYSQTFTNSTGCDSVVIMHLRIGQFLPIIVNYSQGMRPDTLVNRYFASNGTTLYNAKWNWTSAVISGSQIGYFSNTNSSFPFSEGIIMSTGNIDVAPGPNSSGSASNTNGVTSAPLDSSLSALGGNNYLTTTNVLEFDFQATADTFAFTYIFGSEEYPEYVCSSLNDIFAFFLTGPDPYSGFHTTKNIALIPNTVLPVTINSLNGGTPGSGFSSSGCTSLSYSQYYHDNTSGTAVQFDGYTVPLTATDYLMPCNEYHLKISLANAADQLYDSGLFLEKGSFYMPHNTLSEYSDLPNNDTIVNGINTKTIDIHHTEPARQSMEFAAMPSANSTAVWGEDFVLTHISQNGDTTLLTPGNYNFSFNQGDTLQHLNIAVAPTATFTEGEVKTVELILSQLLCDNFTHLDGTSEPLIKHDTFMVYLADSIFIPSRCQRIDVKNERLTLVPNPASSSVTITGINPSDIKETTILALDGKIVKKIMGEEAVIDISNLPNAVYIVRIVTQDGKVSHAKLLKN